MEADMAGNGYNGASKTGGLASAISGEWGDSDEEELPLLRCESPGCTTILSRRHRLELIEREKKRERRAKDKARREAKLREELGLAPDAALPPEHAPDEKEEKGDDPVLCSPCRRKAELGEIDAEEDRHRESLNRTYGFAKKPRTPRHDS